MARCDVWNFGSKFEIATGQDAKLIGIKLDEKKEGINDNASCAISAPLLGRENYCFVKGLIKEGRIKRDIHCFRCKRNVDFVLKITGEADDYEPRVGSEIE